MQWSDDAILLSTRKIGESSVIARIFTRDNGVCAGMIRGAHGKKMRGIIQPGNTLKVVWQARLTEQLGTLSCEMHTARAALMLNDSQKLLALQTICHIIENTFPERHPYPRFYQYFTDFLDMLIDARNWHKEYVLLELAILAQTGFGLDLSRCADTFSTENLTYISPKSGRAVCETSGKPYHHKLLPLPQFLRDDNHEPTASEISEGLNVSEYFLNHWLLEPNNKKMPASRQRLVTILAQQMAEP